METNLRPLSLGEVLDRTAHLYRTNFLLFYGIAAVYAGLLLFLGLCKVGVEAIMRAAHMNSMVQALNWIFILVIYLVIFLFGAVPVAATTRAVAWLHLGEPATIRSAYASVLPRFWRYLWLMTLKTFFAWGPAILLYTLIVVAMILAGFGNILLHPEAAPTGAGNEPTTAFFVGIGMMILCFLLLIPAFIVGVFMALRYALAVPACVVENLTARQALKRSIHLTKESRGRIFILWLLVFIIEIGLVMITQIFFMIAAFKHPYDVPAWMEALSQVIGFFTNAFVGPILAAGITLFYYDQRIRKEGFDIEWMMQAAGLTVPAPETSFTAQAGQPISMQTLPLASAPAQDALIEPAPQSGSAHE